MQQERLLVGLCAWLRDSDVPPPDARMSASRVMAGVEATPRLGRWWPPARFVPAPEPAPELGAFGPDGPPPRPAPRVQAPPVRDKVRAVVTSVRLLAVASVVALVCGAALVTASLLPGASPPTAPAVAAVASPPPQEAPSPTPSPSPTPTPTPVPTALPWPSWPPSDRALDWHGGGVRLEADELRLRIGHAVYGTPAEVLVRGSTDPDRAQLEAHWYEGQTEQRLLVELEAGEDDWWVSRIRTYDGRRRGDWIDFSDLAERTRTPIGQALESDLQAGSTGAGRKGLRKPGSATLDLSGLRLSAFGPGTRRAPLTGCQLFEGTAEQLAGLVGATPTQAAAALAANDLCYVFDHSWPLQATFADERLAQHLGSGFDRRCSAPAAGTVVSAEPRPVAASQGTGSVIFVGVVEDEPADHPLPPPAGTDCPAL